MTDSETTIGQQFEHANAQRDIDLVDELRAQPVETPWLEFKANLSDEDKIGKLISALSN